MTKRNNIRRALWLIFGSLLSIPLMIFAVKFILDNFVEHVPPNQGAMVLGLLIFATWTLIAIFVVIVSLIGVLIAASRPDPKTGDHIPSPKSENPT